MELCKINIGRMEGGCVELPASKSVCNRLLVMEALCGAGGMVGNVARCDDTDALCAALKRISVSEGADSPLSVNIGAAGTAMRFLTAFIAASNGVVAVVDGSERMRQRPIAVLVEALRQCGASIDYLSAAGFSPLLIKGRRLHSEGPIAIRGDVSSQYISALMMIAPYVDGGLSLRLTTDLTSRPYVEMTASLMRQFGAVVDVAGSSIRVAQGGYKAVRMTVEGDWSAASYWYEIKSLFPDVPMALNGLSPRSVQGDCRVAEYFRNFGITTDFSGGEARLGYDASLKADRLDLNLSGEPDLAQTLVVTSCLHKIPFRITGLATLKIKETDRIEALKSQLSKLGYDVEANDDGELAWNGGKHEIESVPQIATFSDHRMAMAFAPAAALFPGVRIENPAVVNKSYPDYWNQLQKFGFKLDFLNFA